MSTILGVLLTIAAFLGLVVLAVLRALALDEVTGRIARRAERSIEETIASLPAEQQAEWADEWRAEVASLRSLPFSALLFARGVRVSAAELVGAQSLAGAAERSATGRRTGDLPRGTERLRSIAGRMGTTWGNVAWKRFAGFLGLLVPAALAVGISLIRQWPAPWISAVVLAITLAVTIIDFIRER